MNTVLVFTGRGGIDSLDFRQQLLRVPEVSIILKSAQESLDRRGYSKDLVSLVQSDNNDYLSSGLWRELVAQLVQMGLFTRYRKLSIRPQFIVGESGDCTASMVCLGQKSLEDLIENFSVQMEKRHQEEKSTEYLVGHRLETSKVYQWNGVEYVVAAEGKEAWYLIEDIRKDHLVDQVITLGMVPVAAALRLDQDLGIVESVVIDPLLSWIWPFVRGTLVPVAAAV